MAPDLSNRPKIILGAGQFGGPRVPDTAAVKAQCTLFHSYNHTTIDTSRAYPLEHLGRSEELLASSGTTAWATIDTKINSLIEKALSKENVRKSIEESLKALGVEQVDVMYLTLRSVDVRFEETVEAMDAAWREGRFRRFGLSNYSPGEVEEIVEFAEKRGFVKPTVYQGQYNPVARLAEKELLPVLRKYGIAFYAYSGKVTKDSINLPEGRFSNSTFAGKFYSASYLRDELLSSAMKVHEAAQKHGLTGHAVAMRWVLHHSALRGELGDAMLFSAAHLSQIEENLKICDQGSLPEELVKVVDDIWAVAEPVAPWAWIDVKAQAAAIKEGLNSMKK
ncbi:hypothetical protein M409DRAFT_23566 [Zasmidium cellare ATCC 36951]|uniref:NADP-dependent oxidoreductase domain-containing protein n=1 Tax=Zasmidium cellare ATCC 36951 TaxID=1080233 RepID=A0A6A6CLR5_ZASCE|nr:uncharacterized protein M409DRAFT_23566 [Zasmidium cellare ATCC 36951]KAF2166376.1 hypothetical protein M409DRAFT_23566 [Zasmidium cellare ATCC 36951]